MKKHASLLKCVAITALLGAIPAYAGTPADTLVMARNIDAISTFDPAQIGEVVTDELILNICDSLVGIDPEDEAGVVPSIAKDWTVSEDGMKITFNLVEDAVFPSGKPVTAKDVAWSLQRVLTLGFGNAATMTEYGFSADTAEADLVAVDDRTFEMNLSRPYPIALILQAIAANRVAAVLDSETLIGEEVDGDLGNKYLTTNSACVGPYALRQWNAGEVVVLEANANYDGPAPQMKRIIIRHVAEAQAQRLLLEQGDIDVARDLGAEDLRDLNANPDIQVVSTPKHQIYYTAFNNGDPRFADDRVRLAFKYLMDYDALADTVMAFLGIPRASVVPLGALGALDKDEGQPFSLDLEKAKALLTEAGYGDGFSARLFIGTLPYTSAIAQHLQANAAKVGIDLKIEQMANAQLFSAFRGREFDTVMLSWQTAVPHAHGMLSRHAVNPDNSLEAALTMFPSWRGAWFSEDFNKRVDEALFEKDEAKQIELYKQIQRDHMQTGPFAYQFQLLDTAALHKTVSTWKWNAFRVYYADIEKG
ncbi:ABC transporter substrate-binding protein [Oceaniovalibus sp. ACAM 378]|uniref:ABC transporter substrate-binding protein n=1 Tax=Oceaniovalibus sp. ACAM 378 TaxID=2599923 RepID=UPI0011D800AB|nr:ABC transporter substrate-binding protein [Oceaniovalibus sp. ACAM 378]TYB83911.1 ABC transporter substrate-binding protein [Oceaniovalibus sp. ACAM 378]